MTVHNLKTAQSYFEDVRIGVKPFEIRYNDRKFNVGDRLLLREIDDEQQYTGRSLERTVTYILGSGFGLIPGWVVLGLACTEPTAPTRPAVIPRPRRATRHVQRGVMDIRPLTPGSVGTCDWGDCDELSVVERRDPESDQWLPVCEMHGGPVGEVKGWIGPADEPRGNRVTFTTPTSEHETCTWKQVGLCVWCDDHGIRLYQGDLPEARRTVPKCADKDHDWDPDMGQGFYLICLTCGHREWLD